nr:PAS domain-containing protein [uncultured Rhodopila sp.]
MTAGASVPDFDEPQLAKAVERLTPEEVHALPYGAVRLDAEGTVTFYSDAERRLSGYRKDVVGRTFFTEIAPCMNNPGFKGRIDKALAAGKLDIAFGFTGDMPTAAMDLDVRVQSATGGGCWIFLRREV